jgi:hypothetical protein
MATFHNSHGGNAGKQHRYSRFGITSPIANRKIMATSFLPRLFRKSGGKLPEGIDILIRNNCVGKASIAKVTHLREYMSPPMVMRAQLGSGSNPMTPFKQSQHHLDMGMGTIQRFGNGSQTRLGKATPADCFMSLVLFARQHNLPHPGLIFISNVPTNGVLHSQVYRYLLVKHKFVNDIMTYDHVSLRFMPKDDHDTSKIRCSSMLYTSTERKFILVNVTLPEEMHDALTKIGKMNETAAATHRLNIQKRDVLIAWLKKQTPIDISSTADAIAM